MKKTIVILLIATTNISSCQNKKENNESMSVSVKNKKYNFTTTACAPKLYPAEIVDGAFFLADGTTRYIPSGGVMKTGWGNFGATHIGGADLKALPVKLSLTWVSYVEKKFYRGQFELDKNLIANYFEKGYINQYNKQETYNEIKAGVAPGGIVVVWINGGGSQIEIGKFKAKGVQVSMKEFKPNAILSMEEYMKLKIEGHVPKEYQNIEFLENIPFGLWDEYRKKYTWKPKVVFVNKGESIFMNIHYYNGEKILTNTKNSELFEYNERAVPKYINLHWEDKDKNPFGAYIYFDNEEEILNIFKSFFNKSETKKGKLVLKIDKYNSHIQLFLEDENNKIEISKVRIKTYIKSKE